MHIRTAFGGGGEQIETFGQCQSCDCAYRDLSARPGFGKQSDSTLVAVRRIGGKIPDTIVYHMGAREPFSGEVIRIVLAYGNDAVRRNMPQHSLEGEIFPECDPE